MYGEPWKGVHTTELFGNKTTIGGYLTQGDPRSVWLSMTTDF
ncbi:hypothetical protein [Burkholderia sp. JKS000303]|nr:hypothetical protein [Burkholderia sp. JKS000303]